VDRAVEYCVFCAAYEVTFAPPMVTSSLRNKTRDTSTAQLRTCHASVYVMSRPSATGQARSLLTGQVDGVEKMFSVVTQAVCCLSACARHKRTACVTIEFAP